MKIISRIVVVLVGIAVAFSWQVPASATASTTEEARGFVQSVADKALSLAGSESLKADQKEQKLGDLFDQSVDKDWMAKFVMGKYWRDATPEQRKQYVELYGKFLRKTYVSKFRQYTNQKLDIKNVSAQEEGDFLVETLVLSEKSQPVKVDYKLRKGTSGKFEIFDIIAEGVSLITTQRSEFASILSRDGVDGLMAKLKERLKASA